MSKPSPPLSVLTVVLLLDVQYRHRIDGGRAHLYASKHTIRVSVIRDLRNGVLDLSEMRARL